MRYPIVVLLTGLFLNACGSPLSGTSSGLSTGSYTVTPSGDTHETFSPSVAQTVSSGQTLSFVVTANTNSAVFSTVTGTCPLGSWSNSTYTTGAITANCTVIFSGSA